MFFKLKRLCCYDTFLLAPSDHGKERVRQAVLESLKKLNTSYLDLYLVHWPGAGRLPSQSPANKSLRIETWLELEQLQKEGKLRSIGVSNYLESHLQELFAACSIKPAVNQVNFYYSILSKPYHIFGIKLLRLSSTHISLKKSFLDFARRKIFLSKHTALLVGNRLKFCLTTLM